MFLLSDHTTLRVGGAACNAIQTDNEADFIAAIQSADKNGIPLLVLGGGSNLLVADEGFDGLVVQDSCQGVEVLESDHQNIRLRIPAGHAWDMLAAQAADSGWSGIEALAGIPGTTGAAPVQNIGAYGCEISQCISGVRVWDRELRTARLLKPAELAFGYRNSMLKRSLWEGGEPALWQSPDSATTNSTSSASSVASHAPYASHAATSSPARDARECSRWHPTPRCVVLDVELVLGRSLLSSPIVYTELARALGVQEGARALLTDVRAAVLELRARKGMLEDDHGAAAAPDYDRWSAGSFFTNPITTAAKANSLPPEAPRYPAGISGQGGEALVKLSAAWLIQHAGFDKGYGVHGSESRARLSLRHTLAITNRGQASAADIVELALAVQKGVVESFGIKLAPEPILAGFGDGGRLL